MLSLIDSEKITCNTLCGPPHVYPLWHYRTFKRSSRFVSIVKCNRRWHVLMPERSGFMGSHAQYTCVCTTKSRHKRTVTHHVSLHFTFRLGHCCARETRNAENARILFYSLSLFLLLRLCNRWPFFCAYTLYNAMKFLWNWIFPACTLPRRNIPVVRVKSFLFGISRRRFVCKLHKFENIKICLLSSIVSIKVTHRTRLLERQTGWKHRTVRNL